MNNTEIAFFLPPKTMNEATIYYVDILKQGFEQAGYTVTRVENLKELKSFNKVFVMSAKWCFIVKLFNPRAKIVTWFQGLGAEEALMTKNSLIRKRLWNCVEFFTMKFSWLNIYVSARMHKYYRDTYGILDRNFFIMPCFNKQLNSNAFNMVGKYKNPTFVYAGGLDKWQCIEETLELFSLIEKQLQNASLTLLTKDKLKAEELIKKYHIKNYSINFVSLEELDDELRKYKYGFLIREDHVVNNVSTPTKMNSYLANGIIPIYTNVIDDFEKISLGIELNSETQGWLDEILKYEDNFSTVEAELFRGEVERVFSQYYNEDNYIRQFFCKIKKIVL
ncbi:hypothetical protein [Acinetobacter ursingii]|uniref:hypothetical protein n=1 Tax=Acinetobacter ursingii TaxID=108980 RepID=UPI0012503B22|nr:hypothetical protein [Acinetobacter ursingii]